MAGDWIKMRADLHTHPKVVRMASALKADRLLIVGGLHAVWCLFDMHSEDGMLSGYTTETVDELIGFKGFAWAMCAVQWLKSADEGLLLPEFDEHNGQSAKRRATETKRKRQERESREELAAEKAAASARKVSASDADRKRSREEKRREDIETPPNPPQAGDVVGVEGQSPSKAGTVCKAIRARGVPDVNPGNPELIALIAQGVAVETFEAAADTCAKATPPKGMGYLLGIIKRQLGEAAAIAAGPKAASTALDPESQLAIEAEGVRLGIGKWSGTEQFPAYKARVRAKQSAEHATPAGVH
jgi:hypothetical protein